MRIKLLGDCYYCVSMFDSQSWKSRPDHAVCSVETGLHMIRAIKDVRHDTRVSGLFFPHPHFFILFRHFFPLLWFISRGIAGSSQFFHKNYRFPPLPLAFLLSKKQ